jgi:hypothetical protein
LRLDGFLWLRRDDARGEETRALASDTARDFTGLISMLRQWTVFYVLVGVPAGHSSSDFAARGHGRHAPD